MDSQFWIKAWNEGRTNFHQDDFHQKLTEYFPALNPQPGQSVLVPLCGKSKDLLWLHQQKLNVHGVELYDHAVESFFSENHLSPVKTTQSESYKQYSFQHILISCGDFFKLNQADSYDFVYDRAALVALPREMRKTYAQVITQALRVGGKYLLVVYAYDQSKLEGPPFSVDDQEVHELYQDHFSIKIMESQESNKEGQRLASLDSLRQVVYILEKKS